MRLFFEFDIASIGLRYSIHVGDRIQAMYLTDNVALVFSKEAHVLRLPPNCRVRDEEGTFLDIVCGAPEDSNYFMSLPDA